MHSSTFSQNLIQAVSDWQRGGSAAQKKKRGERLKLAAESLPSEFRSTSLVCFRQIALDSAHLWILGDDLKLAESLSAWTTDLSVAVQFKGGVPPKGYQGIIFEHIPSPEQVILNLGSLFQSPEFRRACQTHAAAIPGYGDGIARYWNSQAEVVLQVPELSIDAVYAFGGFSSDRDELAAMFFGRTPSPNDLKHFDYLLAQNKQQLGGRWLRGDGAKRIVRHLLAHVEQLRPHHPRYKQQ